MSWGGGQGGRKEGFEEFTHDVDGATWQLLKGYGRSRWPEFAVGAFAGVISRGLELVPAFALGVAVDSLLTSERPYSLPLIPEAWLPTDLWGQFWIIVGMIGAAFFVGAGLNWVNSWAWNRFAQHVQHAARVDTYDSMQALKMDFFDDKQTGEIMSILNNDVNQLERFLTGNLNMGIRIAVMVLGTAAIMFLLNWQLALVSMLVVPVLAAVSYVFVRIIQPKYVRVRASVGALNSRLENNLGGIEVIKSYTTESFESRRVEDASREYLDANWDAITTRIKFWPTLEALTGVGYLVTFIVGGIWVVFGAPGPFSGTLSAGVLITFLMYTQRFMWPMRQFGEIVNNYQYAEAACQRILGLISQPETVPERETPIELSDLDGRVEYDDVTFRYGDARAGDAVLRSVDFTVEPGEYVGVVGSTGAGKTTLVTLLMRLYDVDEGAIRIDGHDLRDVSAESLRRSIGYVSQEPFLFYGTIRENIAYGSEGATDEAVIDAAKRAGAWEFIRELPGGLDTMVGERGIKLSGGQRQRVSIARAILKDPDVLILDEATSHVDNETEVLIRAGLEDLVAGRTTIAIAHRLSTVRDADRILVLDDGVLVQQGTHDELLQGSGLYASLWSIQVGEIERLPPEFVERATRRARGLESD